MVKSSRLINIPLLVHLPTIGTRISTLSPIISKTFFLKSLLTIIKDVYLYTSIHLLINKSTFLVHCKQILHRYHRIPKFFSPPVYLDALNAVQFIYKNCLDIGLSYLNFPKPEKPLKDIKFLKEKAI